MRKYFTFDDVGMIPKFNKIASRMNTSIETILGKDRYASPFVPANMDSVICPRLAKICKDRGAPIIFHRFAPIEQQIKWVKDFPDAYTSIGVQESAQNFQTLYDAGCRRFCIDIAHGHSQIVLDTIKRMKDKDQNITVLAGNVCTYHGLLDLANSGADIVKVGVGPGAACITRMMTGFGVPQFSAIQDCKKAKDDFEGQSGKKVHLVADGGIKHPKDGVLALAAGADAVMMGFIFAKTFESAAPKHEYAQKVYGRYRGQASTEFMNEFFEGKKKRQAEGVAFDVEISKSAKDVFEEFEGGLRSALTYCGTDNLTEFRSNVEFFESTRNFLIESNYRK